MSARPRRSGALGRGSGPGPRRTEGREARLAAAGDPGSTSAPLRWRPGARARGAVAAAGSSSVPTWDGSSLCPRVGLLGGWECALGKRPGGPGRAPPGRRRDRVQHADSALEGPKELCSECSVPELLQPFASFLRTQVPKPRFALSSFPLPHFPSPRLSPRFLYLPFSLFAFSCLGSWSTPGRPLFPFPSVFLFHFVSRSFFNPFCSFSSFLTFVASLLLSLHWLCSPWANECPSAAVCGHPERARGTQLAPRTTGCTPGISGALRV